MLAQTRRQTALALRPAAEFDRLLHLVIAALDGMFAASEEPGRGKVRIVVDIRDVARGAPWQVERAAHC